MFIKKGQIYRRKLETSFQLWVKKPLNDKLAKAGRLSRMNHSYGTYSYCWRLGPELDGFWPDLPSFFRHHLSLPHSLDWLPLYPLHPPVQLLSQLSFRKHCSLPPLLSNSVGFCSCYFFSRQILLAVVSRWLLHLLPELLVPFIFLAPTRGLPTHSAPQAAPFLLTGCHLSKESRGALGSWIAQLWS